jgi:hypothetical protein
MQRFKDFSLEMCDELARTILYDGRKPEGQVYIG